MPDRRRGLPDHFPGDQAAQPGPRERPVASHRRPVRDCREEGRYRAAGVDGKVTGYGANVIIIDDPIKDRAEAESVVMRDKAWDWYRGTLYPRLERGAGCLLIQTRWHHDDLAGRLLDAAKSGQGDRWNVVNFSAIAEEDEPHRRKGEALHEERLPLHELLDGHYSASPLLRTRPPPSRLRSTSRLRRLYDLSAPHRHRRIQLGCRVSGLSDAARRRHVPARPHAGRADAARSARRARLGSQMGPCLDCLSKRQIARDVMALLFTAPGWRFLAELDPFGPFGALPPRRVFSLFAFLWRLSISIS